MTDWSPATVWWLLSLMLVLAELATGTFYLLMLAAGVAVGGLAAWWGAPAVWQMLLAALAGGAAVGALYHRRKARAPVPPAAANPDLNLDVGQWVEVGSWNAQGQATVLHRGAQWQARHQGPATPQPGPHRIVAIDGICLVLSPLP